MKRLVALILMALVFAACSGDSTEPTAGSTPGPTLTIEGRAFGQPPEVAAGDSITIDNRDSVRHTFTSSDEAWPEVSLAGSSSSVFTVPADLAAGSYRFICLIHSDMGGTLNVTG